MAKKYSDMRLAVPVAAALLYGASLSLPAYNPSNPRFSTTTSSGESAFEAGWRVLTAWAPGELDWWVLSAAWLANPAIWLGVIAAASSWWRLAQTAGGIGVVLSLSALTRFAEMIGWRAGYWAWVSSAAVIMAGSALARLRESGTETEKTHQ